MPFAVVSSEYRAWALLLAVCWQFVIWVCPGAPLDCGAQAELRMVCYESESFDYSTIDGVSSVCVSCDCYPCFQTDSFLTHGFHLAQGLGP